MICLFLYLGLLAPLQERGGEVVFEPDSAEAEIPEPFRLPAARFKYEREPIRLLPTYAISKLRFPSPIETPDPENNTVHAEYFQSMKPGGRPGVVVLHILGADFALSRFMAARLADQGVHALFLKLPYYGERRPALLERSMISVDLERSTLTMRQGVCDVRRALAWLASRPEVDPGYLGVTGISLGGIVSSLVASIDPRVERAAILLAGGNLPDILWKMPEPEAKRARDRWIEQGLTQEKLAEIVRPFDPLTHAERMKNKRILMYAALVDEVIPPANAEALWNAAGRPPIRWLECGHYSAVGFLLPSLREATRFLATGIPPDTSTQ